MADEPPRPIKRNEMPRQLAKIERVAAIEPIEGADRIELARVRGWQCVVKKGEFQPGDIGVYFEIDSWLPIEERFEFLRGSSYKKTELREGFRLKTMRLRGQLSQGLLMPASAFPELTDPQPGMDVTAELGVVLYEAPVPVSLSGEIIGQFPGFLSKSDQERIQNLLEYFERYRHHRFEVSIKLDGTSMTAYYRDGAFGVCSRNLELADSPKNTHWQLAHRLRLRERLAALGRNLALQGELCGEGIQKNPERIQGRQLFVFDVFDIDRHRYLAPEERQAVLARLNAVEGEEPIAQVPILGTQRVLEEHPTLDALLAFADGPGYRAKIREGIVCKSVPNEPDEEVVSFKVINNRFLLLQAD